MLGYNKRRPSLFFLGIPLEREDPESHQLYYLTLLHQLYCLIFLPKKTEAFTPQEFPPVSLISGVYKILVKVLSNRIKETLHEAIDGNQFAFIKVRNILDCILVANETVEDYRHRKKRGLILKLDLEKAYDYTSWSSSTI